jgi:hypothetical protein
MKKLIPYTKLIKMIKKDKLLKAILDDRVQDVAEGRTSKWTCLTSKRNPP